LDKRGTEYEKIAGTQLFPCFNSIRPFAIHERNGKEKRRRAPSEQIPKFRGKKPFTKHKKVLITLTFVRKNKQNKNQKRK
jgi:hypothetical protein